MPVVYIVQEVRNRDYAPAVRYGELKLILPEGNITLSTAPTIRRLRKALRDFKHEEDYLMCSGDPIAIGLACAVLSDVTGGKFKLLKWDNREGVYFPLEADVRGRFAEHE